MESDETSLAEALHGAVESALGRLEGAVARAGAGARVREYGRVIAVEQSVVRIAGLPEVGSDELLVLPAGGAALALDLAPGEVGAALLDRDARITAGDEVHRAGRVLDVPVGEALLGRVIDPLGRPLDRLPAPRAPERWPVERPAPPIIARAPVTEPLETGVTVVDAMIPVGRGQRELICGDRQTGKTALALDAIIRQRDTGVLCVYCAIGQRATAVARVIDALRRAGALAHTVVVVADAEDPPGLLYVAPYAATSIAEWFAARGRDALVVYDDLTRHARAHRELALLLRRPPGREAFPGDVFYLHARLLERSTRLRTGPDGGAGGSLTALPIVETEAENLAAYIPTNLVSITDGQLYLSPGLFRKGQLPAVDVGRSVSRVGGKAQRPAWRTVAGEMKLTHAQSEGSEAFARFGTRLDPPTQKALERGRRLRAVLLQPLGAPQRMAAQLAVLLALQAGTLDDTPVEDIPEVAARVRDAILRSLPDDCARIERGAPLDDETRARWAAVAQAAVEHAAVEQP